MKRFLMLYRSVLGKKAIVAVTGAIMLGFLILHVVGNLKTFLPDAGPGVPDIDFYSQYLRSMGEPILPHLAALWIFRVVLTGAAVLHVVCVFQLALLNRRARPVGYDRVEYMEVTTSGRFMLITGTLLLVFLVFHLLQFTTGSIDAARFIHGAVYRNLHLAFHEWHYVALYLIALAALGLHLYHGTWSFFQSLGLDNPDRNRGLRRFAIVIAVALPLTFASVPIAFFVGMMKPPPEISARVGGSH